MNTPPIYKINGYERKRQKRMLSEMKSFVRSFWKDHQTEKDCAMFYAGTLNGVMSDEQAKAIYERYEKEIAELESKLSELYNP
jgi:hypothetical protein